MAERSRNLWIYVDLCVFPKLRVQQSTAVLRMHTKITEDYRSTSFMQHHPVVKTNHQKSIHTKRKSINFSLSDLFHPAKCFGQPFWPSRDRDRAQVQLICWNTLLLPIKEK